jgi:hypothetical protein
MKLDPGLAGWMPTPLTLYLTSVRQALGPTIGSGSIESDARPAVDSCVNWYCSWRSAWSWATQPAKSRSAESQVVELESWRRRADSNRRIRVLQTLALPLGHVAAGEDDRGSSRFPSTRKAARAALGAQTGGRRVAADAGQGSKKGLERETGLEPATPTLARLCSTTELFPPTGGEGYAGGRRLSSRSRLAAQPDPLPAGWLAPSGYDQQGFGLGAGLYSRLVTLALPHGCVPGPRSVRPALRTKRLTAGQDQERLTARRERRSAPGCTSSRRWSCRGPGRRSGREQGAGPERRCGGRRRG